MANNKIQVKRTNTAGRSPNTTDPSNTQYIAAGEFALNMADGILYTSNGSAVIEIGANNTSSKVTGNITADGIVSGSELTSTLATGDEGGQINLAKPPNATTAGGVTIDAYQNKIRIFEQGGNARGAYIDLTACANGVGTNLLTGGSGGTGTVTSVGSANGISGGPITGSGTLYAVAGNSTVFVNASGIHVNTSALPTVNLNSQYVWTNTQTFQANISFTGNNISLVTNTGSIFFAGSSDANWRIGRNTGATTKYYYTNNSLDIIAANSNLEGIVFGWTGNSYLETGYSGTFTQLPIYVGNTTVNVSINSTAFSGTANNTSFVGSVSAANVVSNAQLSGNLANYVTTTNLTNNLANYQTTAGLEANVAVLAANSATYLGNSITTGANISSWITGNAATAYSNAVSYVDGKSYVNTNQLSTNLSNYASLSGANFTGAVTVANDFTVTGNLTLSGNTVIVGANNLVVQDAVISLHTPANLSSLTSNDGKNIGLAFHYYDTEDKHALLYRDNATGYLQYHTDGGDPISNSNPTGNNLGTIQAAVFWAGNSSVYSTINSTAFSGIANSATYFGAAGNLGNSSGIYTSANINFTSTGQRITGNFSGAPVADRLMFQTSTSNSLTSIGVIPNGNSTQSQISLESDPAVTNGSTAQFIMIGNSDTRLASGIRGTGTYLPMTFYTGDSERMRISNTGNVGIGNTAPTDKLSVNGTTYLQANVTLNAALIANSSAGSNGQVLSSNGTTAYWSALAKLSRVSSTTSITSPLAWNSDNYDTYITTAQAEALTINADAGTPSDGQKIIFRFKDNGTARALTFTTGVSKGFRAVGTTLPTTTTASKVLYVGCIYNAGDSRWDVIATGEEA